MPGKPREMTTMAERRFPVRIRIGVPPGGFGQRYSEMTAWLDENCGADGWVMTPSGMRGVLNDAVSIYFFNATLASAFVALNPHHRSTTYLQELREPGGLAGNVAILSHSGGLCVGLLTDTRRFGFSHIVSSGNEATVSAAAFLEYLLEDPHTAIVGGFIEAIREPERFAAALNRAAALGKPVVMVKVGRHERTRRAITTHTGGDADDPAAVSALLRAHGAIEVADIVELAETLAAFQTAQRGRWCYGKTPMQTFLDTIPLAREKSLAA